MLINERLQELNMTKYRLSKDSGVPQTTINDICSGKADLQKCAAGTLLRLANVLGVSIEDILQSSGTEYRSDFEIFKSNTCHRVKEMGDVQFMLDLLESDRIRTMYNRRWYPETFYLLAMLDYLSRENHISRCTRYDDIRTQKLRNPVYPAGVIVTGEVMGSEEPLRMAEQDAIPEFRRFNIMENEVRNVI